MATFIQVHLTRKADGGSCNVTCCIGKLSPAFLAFFLIPECIVTRGSATHACSETRLFMCSSIWKNFLISRIQRQPGLSPIETHFQSALGDAVIVRLSRRWLDSHFLFTYGHSLTFFRQTPQSDVLLSVLLEVRRSKVKTWKKLCHE